MENIPEEVKKLMKDIPVVWDETKFLCGFPGKDVVIARRKGNVWYIAGINGAKDMKNIKIDLEFIPNIKQPLLVSNGDDNRSFNLINKIKIKDKLLDIQLKSDDGFLLRVELEK